MRGGKRRKDHERSAKVATGLITYTCIGKSVFAETSMEKVLAMWRDKVFWAERKKRCTETEGHAASSYASDARMPENQSFSSHDHELPW